MPVIDFGSGANGPLASLEFGTKYTTTSFPEDLAESPYFILFRANKRYQFSEAVEPRTEYTTDGGEAEQSKFLKTANKIINVANKVKGFVNKIEEFTGTSISVPSHSFALPIPTNLATGYNAQYDTPSLGPLGRAGQRVAQNYTGTDDSFYNDLKSAISSSGSASPEALKGTLSNLATAVAGQADIASVLGVGLGGLVGAPGTGAVIGAAAGNIGLGVLSGLGIARNPHIANVFTGVNFKTHSFQYKLIARNKKESDTIRELIRNFKYHMAPDYREADHVFTYPSQFQIIIRAGDYLFKIADSVLTTFDVNYTGEGAPYFFEDTNAPYSVTINMSFTEDTIVTKREVREGR